MASIHLYFARKQVGDTPKRGKPEMRSSCRNSLDLHWSPWPRPGRGSASVPHLRYLSVSRHFNEQTPLIYWGKFCDKIEHVHTRKRSLRPLPRFHAIAIFRRSFSKLVKHSNQVAQLHWFSAQSCIENWPFLKPCSSLLLKKWSQERISRKRPNLALLLINTLFPKLC